jgi:dTDP-4-dehydrorhamnose reductase
VRPTVVIGHGLIGAAVAGWLSASEVPVISVARSRGTLRCDLTRPDGRELMLAALRGAQPRAVVLAHGPSDVTWCEREPEAAARAHEGIAGAVSGTGVPVVLTSTDNVFDGSRPRSSEADPVNPQNADGRAKLAAERAIAARPRNVILRVSLVYGWSGGQHRANFAEHCLRAARVGQPLRVPFDQEFTPVHVADVARVAAAVALEPDDGYDPLDLMRGWPRPPAALHVKDLETSQAASWPAGRGWVSYGPQRPIRFRTLGRGQLPWPSMIDTLLGEGSPGSSTSSTRTSCGPGRRASPAPPSGCARCCRPPARRETW